MPFRGCCGQLGIVGVPVEAHWEQGISVSNILASLKDMDPI